MRGKKPYYCQPSHFTRDSPGKPGCSSNKNYTGYSPVQGTHTPEFPATHCPCGAGFCVIQMCKTGRARYLCPGRNVGISQASYLRLCCSYWKWCDKLKDDEILRSQPYPYPLCSCGAGIARLETVKFGSDAGRKYFACNIIKGNGACSFHLWYDDYMQRASTSNEINLICEAFENGKMQLDFPSPPKETPDEIQINASENEIFAGDVDTHTPTPPTYVASLNVPQTGVPSTTESLPSIVATKDQANWSVLRLSDTGDRVVESTPSANLRVMTLQQAATNFSQGESLQKKSSSGRPMVQSRRGGRLPHARGREEETTIPAASWGTSMNSYPPPSPPSPPFVLDKGKEVVVEDEVGGPRVLSRARIEFEGEQSPSDGLRSLCRRLEADASFSLGNSQVGPTTPEGNIAARNQFEEEHVVAIPQSVLDKFSRLSTVSDHLQPEPDIGRGESVFFDCPDAGGNLGLRWLRGCILPKDKEALSKGQVAPFATAAHDLMLLHRSMAVALEMGIFYQQEYAHSQTILEQHQGLVAKVVKLEADLAAEKEKLFSSHVEKEELQASLASIQLEFSHYRVALEQERQETADATARLDQLDAENVELKREKTELEQEKTRLADQVSQLQSNIRDLEADFKDQLDKENMEGWLCAKACCLHAYPKLRWALVDQAYESSVRPSEDEA